MLTRLFKAFGPIAPLFAGALLSGCDNMTMRINDEEGVPLSELDQNASVPTELVLAGPDDVVITDGSKLAIAVSGDPKAVEALRFTLADGTLGILREKGSWSDKGKATVRVTMPSPEKLTLAGSGSIEAASLAGASEVTIAGSGTLRAAKISSGKLDLTIAGSGSVKAAGSAETLDLTLAGSGDADMAGLKVGSAEVTIAGSGRAEFASDGKVAANIMGSGEVTVIGRADCTISAMGSGKLNCSTGTARSAAAPANGRAAPPAPPAPEAPNPSPAPDAPAAPKPPEDHSGH